MPQYGGKECKYKDEIEYKIKDDCSSDEKGEWSEWRESECSAQCINFNGFEAKGKRIRYRECEDGKRCENEWFEIKDCYKECKSIVKLCPGEYIDNAGERHGVACSGTDHGGCSKTRTDCKENKPNCYSKCECINNYYGSNCEFIGEDDGKSIALNKQLLNYTITANENIESPDKVAIIVEDLLDNESMLDKTIVTESLRLVNKTINALSQIEKSVRIDTLSSYLKIISSMVRYEKKEKIFNNNRVLIDEDKSIASEAKNLVDEVSKSYSRREAGTKILNLFRIRVTKNKIQRKKEYVEWLRQRRMRTTITICVNSVVFIYIVFMVYINLLYGAKFASQQANS